MAKGKKKSFWKSVAKFFKKLGFRIAGFFVRTVHELRRMRWPSKKVLASATCIVLSFIFLFGVYIVFDDFLIAQIFKLIY